MGSQAAGRIAAIVAIGWVLAHAVRPSLTLQDPVTYLEVGETLLHDLPPGDFFSFRMPLAGILAAEIFDHGRLSVEAWALLFFLSKALLILALSGLLAPAAGLVGALALAAALHPGIQGAFHYQEAAFSLLLLTAAGALVRWAQDPTPRAAALLACAIGASLLLRSTLVLLAPLLVLLQWLAPRPSASRVKTSLILLAVPYLFLLPWILMNWKVFHLFIPLERGAAASNIVGAALGLVETTSGSLPRLVEELGRTSLPRWAAAEILGHPLRYARGFAERLGYVVGLQPLLFVPALIALWLHRRRRDVALLGVLILYYIGIHCLMTVEKRYFEPLWPVLAVPAAAFIFPAQLKGADAASVPARASAAVLAAFLALFCALSAYAQFQVLTYSPRPPDLDAQLRRYPRDSWLLSERARQRLLAGDVAQAIGDLSTAAGLRPDDEELSLRLAEARMLGGDPRDLLAWPASRQNAPLNRETDLYQAIALLRLGRAREADGHVRAALDAGQLPARVRERTDPALYDRLLFDDLDGLVGAAPLPDRIALYGVFSRSAKLSYERERRLAELYRETKRFDRALIVLDSLLDRGRADPDLTLAAAEAAIKVDARTLALKHLDRAAALASSARGRRLAELYRKIARPDRALVLLRSLLAVQPADPELLLAAADAALKIGEQDLARKSLARAAGPASQTPEGRRRLALLLLEEAAAATKAGRRALAARSVTQAVGLTQEPELLRKAALSYQALRDFPRAASLLKRLARSHPADAALQKDLGVCEFLGGRAPEALAHLQTAIRLDPALSEASLTLGAVYAAQGRPQDALAVYDAALSARPDDAARALLLRAKESVRSRRR